MEKFWFGRVARPRPTCVLTRKSLRNETEMEVVGGGLKMVKRGV